MPRPVSSQQALVMAFDDAFALGAETALFSLLRHNPWFDARVIALCDGVGASHREVLSRLYPIELVEVAPEIKSIARRAARSLGCSPGESMRLYSLQLFGLQDLDRAVFLDADTLCTGDVSALFSELADFAAAPDHVELARSLETRRAKPAAHVRHEPYGRPLTFSFNSGVMTVSGRLLTPEIYRDLLGLPGLLDSRGSQRLLDQYVLNRYFDGRVTALDPRYNFLVGSEALLRQRRRLTLADADEVIHAKVVVALDAVDVSEVAYTAAQIYLNDSTLNVPPGKGTGGGTMALPAGASNIKLLSTQSHMHRRGVKFRASLEDGTLLYESDTWSEPPSKQYDPPMPLADGAKISWTCDFENDTSHPLTFGESADTNEMCVLTGFYYPAPDGKMIVGDLSAGAAYLLK